MRALILLICFAIPFSLSAQETRNPWFSEYGIGLETGLTLLEQAPGLDYEPGFAMGPSLYMGIFRHKMHRAVLNLGYLYYFSDRIGGTEQFEITTGYQRLKLAAGYDFCFKFLVVGADVGSAMMIITTQRTYREVDFVGETENGELVYERGDTISSTRDSGVDWGFYAGTSVGVDFSDLFTSRDTGFLEFRIKADYVRRGDRDDFTVSGLIVFWPSGFVK